MDLFFLCHRRITSALGSRNDLYSEERDNLKSDGVKLGVTFGGKEEIKGCRADACSSRSRVSGGGRDRHGKRSI